MRAQRRSRPVERSRLRGYSEHPPYQPGEYVDEAWVRIRHLDPRELDPELLCLLGRLVVEVPPDLEVVGDKADRAHEHLAHPASVQVLEMVEDVRAEPRLACGRLALERERPVVESGSLGDELRRLQELLFVDRACARGERVRGEGVEG